MKAVLLTSGYGAVLAFIVYLANQGDRGHVFSWIRTIHGGDKAGHFLLMGGLSFVVNYSLRCRMLSFFNIRMLLGSLLVTALVAAEELSQLFIPSRTFDPVDFVFDLAGILVFGALALKMTKTSSGSLQMQR